MKQWRRQYTKAASTLQLLMFCQLVRQMAMATDVNAYVRLQLSYFAMLSHLNHESLL